MVEEVNDYQTRLRKILRHLKSGSINSFSIVKRNLWDDQDAHRLLTKLGTSTKRAARKTYKNLPFSHLLRLRIQVNSVIHHQRIRDGKQTTGIPMGSPLSPALAVIVCAMKIGSIR